MFVPTRRLQRQSIPTLFQAITRYQNEVSIHKKGHISEQSIARIWLATRLAGRPVDRIRNTDLIEIKDEWLKAGKAAATVVRRLAFLSHVYTVIRKDWGYDQLANPAQLVRRPAVDNARDRRFYEDIRLRGVSDQECPRQEVEWIIRNTRSGELPTILRIAKETGMRRSEVTFIRREHIDLRHNVIHVPNTKNGKPREVPITPFAKDALRKWLDKIDNPARGRIFTIQPGSVTRAFIRARRRARKAYEALCAKYQRRPKPQYFHDLHFHDARHEATSNLAPVYSTHDLASVTGHTDLRMIMRYHHPRGWELARKLWRSPLGKRQAMVLRQRQVLVPVPVVPEVDVPLELVSVAGAGAVVVSQDGIAPMPL